MYIGPYFFQVSQFSLLAASNDQKTYFAKRLRAEPEEREKRERERKKEREDVGKQISQRMYNMLTRHLSRNMETTVICRE
jgi:hypothetical protein